MGQGFLRFRGAGSGHCEAKGRDSEGQGAPGGWRPGGHFGGLTGLRGAAVGKGAGGAGHRGDSGGQGCPMANP